MKKGIFAICSVLLLLVASIAVLGTGCGDDGAGEGTIEVKATLCGVPWQGPVDYTLTPETGSPVSGTEVPASFNVSAGEWTCEYVSGGDPDSFFDVVTTPTQTVSDGGTITFTLEFELNQDAWINLRPLPWTVSGIPVDPVYETYEAEVFPCQIIDVHFLQGVDGCEEYLAAVNETSYLTIIDSGLNPPGTQIFVVNNITCALNKTPEPPHKYSQTTTIDGEPVTPETPPYTLNPLGVVTLDVETVWQLVKEIDYEKSINWLGISVAPFIEPHPCVLFELVVPGPGLYMFQLDAWAEVELMDAEDINTQNDVTAKTTLWLTVNVGGP
jgi:hypothetical protein